MDIMPMEKNNEDHQETSAPISNLLLRSAQTRYLRLHELKKKIAGFSKNDAPIDSTVTSDGNDDEAMNNSFAPPLNDSEKEAFDKYMKSTQVQTIEELSKKLFDDWKAKTEERNQGDSSEVADMTELAPKKANLDLKRDLNKRLQKVERSMQMAVIELIRQRIKGAPTNDTEQETNVINEGFTNLVEAVGVLYAQH